MHLSNEVSTLYYHVIQDTRTLNARFLVYNEVISEEVLDRLLNLALPRVRDFRGINPNSFDGRGNYNLGIKEQLIFPEIEYDKIDKVRGMDICFVTTAKTDEEAKELLTLLGMPFRA